MTNSIFYFQRLERGDKWTIGLYAVLTFFIFFVFDLDQEIIFYYCFGTQLGLYIFYYKALRNLSFYFIWVGIGLLHLLMFYILKEDSTIQMSVKPVAANLKNTLPMLIVFQVLRLLSLFVQSQELVSPRRSSFKDSSDNRYVKYPPDQLHLQIFREQIL